MKDMSLFLLKNTFGLKMKKGFKNFCNGDTSTSTLDQQKIDNLGGSSSHTVLARPLVNSPVQRESQPTLEEMILQLEVEEKMGRRTRVNDCVEMKHRMSCVNSSDILRSARNALNQYPRFSLDGKDSMYRSSFTNIRAERRSSSKRLPGMVGGESVIWCKPGVVAKLMGLEAMPIPLNSNTHKRERLRSAAAAIIKRSEMNELIMERRRSNMAATATARKKGMMVGACSRTGPS
ncbi:hypothetical protein ACJIZ3_010472 [Penstemon smallii]|uniref:DUF3741 domain-containing protein n=1 Tax=Penstemon smallii TaxID=265156 RepID=A0ABD3TGL1_9LAMI